MKTNVNVRIMDSDYQLLCDIQEKECLIQSADFLNEQLKAFRRTNPNVEMEKLLVMGALRTTFDLKSQIDTLADQARIANQSIQETLPRLQD